MLGLKSNDDAHRSKLIALGLQVTGNGLSKPPYARLWMLPSTRHSQAHFVPLLCTTRDVKGALSSVWC
jgi:hypothetical protein